MQKIWGIKSDVVDEIILLAKRAHPREFSAILISMPEQDFPQGGVINKIQEITFGRKVKEPSVETTVPNLEVIRIGNREDSLSLGDFLNYSGVGLVHNHPSDDLSPSSSDLESFAKFGSINIIIAHPYTEKSFVFYDKGGNQANLQIIRKQQKQRSYVLNIDNLDILLKKHEVWEGTPVMFEDVRRVNIGRKHYRQPKKPVKLLLNNGRYGSPTDVATEYYNSKGYVVIDTNSLATLYHAMGIGSEWKIDHMGYSRQLSIDYFYPKARWSGVTYMPVSGLEKRIKNINWTGSAANLKDTLIKRHESILNQITALGGTTYDDQTRRNENYGIIQDFLHDIISKIRDGQPFLINIFLFLAFSNSYNYEYTHSRFPQLVVYDRNSYDIRFVKIYTHNIATKRKQLQREDRLYYHWNNEVCLIDYEILMIFDEDMKERVSIPEPSKGKKSVPVSSKKAPSPIAPIGTGGAFIKIGDKILMDYLDQYAFDSRNEKIYFVNTFNRDNPHEFSTQEIVCYDFNMNELWYTPIKRLDFFALTPDRENILITSRPGGGLSNDPCRISILDNNGNTIMENRITGSPKDYSVYNEHYGIIKTFNNEYFELMKDEGSWSISRAPSVFNQYNSGIVKYKDNLIEILRTDKKNYDVHYLDRVVPISLPSNLNRIIPFISSKEYLLIIGTKTLRAVSGDNECVWQIKIDSQLKGIYAGDGVFLIVLEEQVILLKDDGTVLWRKRLPLKITICFGKWLRNYDRIFLAVYNYKSETFIAYTLSLSGEVIKSHRIEDLVMSYFFDFGITEDLLILPTETWIKTEHHDERRIQLNAFEINVNNS